MGSKDVERISVQQRTCIQAQKKLERYVDQMFSEMSIIRIESHVLNSTLNRLLGLLFVC